MTCGSPAVPAISASVTQSTFQRSHSPANGCVYEAKPSSACKLSSVASKLADRCEVQVAYAIGIAQPVSIRCETFGTGKINERQLVEIIREVFDLRPGRVIADLQLPV